jgi:hypothetical protein
MSEKATDPKKLSHGNYQAWSKRLTTELKAAGYYRIIEGYDTIPPSAPPPPPTPTSGATSAETSAYLAMTKEIREVNKDIMHGKCATKKPRA